MNVRICRMGRTHSVAQGEDKVLTLTVNDSNGSPRDLTGAYVYFAIKRTDDDATQVVQYDNDAGTGVTLLAQSGATLGQAEIAVAAADTTAEPVGTALVYDVFVRFDPAGADNERVQVVDGTFQITPRRVVIP